jgi:hypothetical protein
MAERTLMDVNQGDPAPEHTVTAEEIRRATAPQSRSLLLKVSGVSALLLCLAVYLLRLDQVVGLFVDDAWYALLAKALATGQGYALINSPSPGIMPIYPPAFPFLLSLVYRLAPQFPENVWLLKLVSVAAMLGAGLVTFRYFARHRAVPPYLALGLAAATVLTPALVFLATSTLMSECVFTLAQVLAVVLIERCVRERDSGRAWRYALMAAALASFAFLTRSVAVALILAIIFYLLKERLLRAAVVFALGLAFLVGPWMLYARAHAPAPELAAEQYGYIVQGYGAQFWQKNLADVYAGTITVNELPARVFKNAADLAGRDFGRMLVPVVSDSLRRSGETGGSLATALSLLLSALALTGFVAVCRERVTLAEIVVPLSLGIVVLWPWEPFRFLLPLTPFLLWYLLAGGRALHRLWPRSPRPGPAQAQWALMGIMIGVLIACNLQGHLKYLLERHGPPAERPLTLRSFDENEELLRWTRKHVPSTEVLASMNPAMLHLFSGHKTISGQDWGANRKTWDRFKVRYLVLTASWSPVPNPDLEGGKYKVVYRGRGGLNTMVIDLGAPTARVP